MQLCRAARAAAIPAAWPIMEHVVLARAELSASCSDEKQRPATSSPSIPAGRSLRAAIRTEMLSAGWKLDLQDAI